MSSLLRTIAAESEKRRQERREKALRERDERRSGLYALSPRLEQIAEERIRIGREIARLALVAAGHGAPGDPSTLQQRLQALAAEEQTILRQLQVAPDTLEVHWACRICQDTGWVQHGDPLGTSLPPAEKCTCRLDEEIDLLYQVSNIRGPQRSYTFEHHDPSLYALSEDREAAEDSLAHCRSFAAAIIAGKTQDSLVLMGDVGRGKTFFASAIANAVLQAHKLALYFTFGEFVQFARRTQFEGQEYQLWAETLQEADLAVLDDLGAERVTDFVKAELFNILNARLAIGKPMVVCTNLSMAQIEETYTARIASRIIGAAEIVRLRGPDLREALRRRAKRSTV